MRVLVNFWLTVVMLCCCIIFLCVFWSLFGIFEANLSILKTGKAKAIRFSTLNSICSILECQPADILEFRPTE